MRTLWKPWLVAIMLAMSWRAPDAAEAISNTETFGGFEFNFNNPGARALGMGGAFAAVADDATAVVSNPAGLVILQRPEVSGEVKFTTFTNSILGYSNTQAEGLAGIYQSRDFNDSVVTPSFFSFVYPTEWVSMAAYVRELINFKSDFSTQGVFIANPLASNTTFRQFPAKSQLEITALDFGFGVGINLAKKHALLPNIGLSVELSIGHVNSQLQRFELPPASSTQVRNRATVDGTDISAGFNAGALWKPWKDLSLGVVYRRGPKFQMQETVQTFAGGVLRTSDVADFTLKVPDVYGGGVAYRFFDRLTLSLDVYQILYSQLLDDFQVTFDRGPITANQYRVDDATEVHVGAEYVFFLWNIPIALRAGYYRDPDHKIRYTGPTDTLQGASQKVLFPGGQNVNHFTGGFGFVPFKGLQIDFATNQSSSVKEYVISTVYRF